MGTALDCSLFNHVLIYMGDLHLVLPALHLTTLAGCWHFDYGATSKNDDALSEHVVLLCVLPLAVHLTFFSWTSRGGPFCVSFSFWVLFWEPSFILKSWWVGGGPQDFSVSPIPLDPNWVFELGQTGLVFGLGALGKRFWGQGLTILRG